MSFLTALLLTAGKSFGMGAMNTIGSAAAALLIPVVVPKITGAVKGFRKGPVEEDCDPDLC